MQRMVQLPAGHLNVARARHFLNVSDSIFKCFVQNNVKKDTKLSITSNIILKNLWCQCPLYFIVQRNCINHTSLYPSLNRWWKGWSRCSQLEATLKSCQGHRWTASLLVSHLSMNWGEPAGIWWPCATQVRAPTSYPFQSQQLPPS